MLKVYLSFQDDVVPRLFVNGTNDQHDSKGKYGSSVKVHHGSNSSRHSTRPDRLRKFSNSAQIFTFKKLLLGHRGLSL